MTAATREALESVGRLLHEAGWDEPPAAPPELTEETLRPIRLAYTSLLRSDYFAIIEQTLGKGRRVEDAGQTLGIGPAESKALFVEALARLRDFADVAEDQGFAAAPGA